MAAHNAAIGEPVRVRVAARDVSVTLHTPRDTSILNVFPASLLELAPEGPAHVLLRLALGEAVLLARITRKSCDALQLEAGRQVFAQVKSVALAP